MCTVLSVMYPLIVHVSLAETVENLRINTFNTCTVSFGSTIFSRYFGMKFLVTFNCDTV